MREEKEEDNHNNRKKKRRSSFKGTYYGIGSQSFVELDEFWSSLFSNKSKNPRQHIQQSNGPLHPATPLHCLVQHTALPSTSLAMRCAWRFVSFERGRGRWTDVMGLEYGVKWQVVGTFLGTVVGGEGTGVGIFVASLLIPMPLPICAPIQQSFGYWVVLRLFIFTLGLRLH